MNTKLENEKNQLTARQIGILKLSASGFTQREIAGELNLSVHTIDYHIRRILVSLRAKNLTNAVVKSIKNGELPL